MATRKINWTKEANIERKEILAYGIFRNKSKTYSMKLNRLFIDTLEILSDSPAIGRKTNFENVYVKIISNYLLFYEFDNAQIKVLSIWDGRREERLIQLNKNK